VKLLILEDEQDLLASLTALCEQENYNVDPVSTYRDAADKISVYNYDCILLDINIPDGSGLQVLDDLKQAKKNDGVIIISARDSLDDRIKSLNLGADDYVIKPFHFSELNARIQAVIRRKKFETTNAVTFGDLEIDLALHTVQVSGTKIALTKKEFDLLQHLVANKNRVLSKNALAEYVWGDHVDSANSFDFLFVHIKNLKKKLKVAGTSVEIKNIYGVGYQIQEQ
jgi:DNA-binding response OmpR family regulator